MSDDPRKKIFASLQAEDKPDFQHRNLRRFNPSDYEIEAREFRESRTPWIPPDPKLVQNVLERLEARYGTLRVTVEEFQRRFMEQHGQKIETEVAVWKAEKAAKALKEEQRASEARVDQTLESALALPDHVLFETRALTDLTSVLEEEDQFVQEIQTQTVQLQTALQSITATAKTLEPEVKPEISSQIQSEHHDLHAQLEQAIGEPLPLFNIKTDAEADEKAKAIGAVAFTQGDTIYFQSGKFDPSSVEGFKLLVHEATHIQQQAKSQAQPGIDSSPELEAQAQQKADAVSSIPTFPKEQLNAFTAQLSRQYKQLGSSPERFSSIAESWHELPSEAKKGVRSRFFLGRNERSQETERLNEAFDSRLNVGLESQRLEASKATREQAFKAPSGIDVQLSVSRQAPLLPGLIGSSLQSNSSQAIQRKPEALAEVVKALVAALEKADLKKTAEILGKLTAAQRTKALQEVLKVASEAAKMRAEGILAQLGDKAVQLPKEILEKFKNVIKADKWEPPGKQDPAYYIGNEAHKRIAANYREKHPGERLFMNNTSFVGILGNLRQEVLLDKLTSKEKLLKPDIFNATKGHLYEIKPANSIGLALTEVVMYQQIFQKLGLRAELGPSNDPGVNGIIAAPGGHYIFASPLPGVIVYQKKNGNYQPKTVPMPVVAAEPKRETEEDFMKHMAAITGLTGTALIIYLIISEGTRLFPPRNLIPIP